MSSDSRGAHHLNRTSLQPTDHSSGFTVCHLSPVEGLDERAFRRQALPAAKWGVRSSIIGPHGESGSVAEIEFVPIARSRSRAMRILLASRGVLPALHQHADIYHVHSPEHILPGLILKLLFRKKVIYDAREDFPAMMLTKTYLSPWLRNLARKLVFFAEQLAARFFDGFVTADSGTLRPHAKSGSSRKLVFYNLPNLQFFPHPNGVQKEFDLVYRGGISQRAGTLVLLDAVHQLAKEGLPVRVLIFGYTDDEKTREAIGNYIRQLHIDHLITLKGRIPHLEMAGALTKARVAVCPLQRIPKFLNNIPVKVFESWACGLPVVATDLPPIRPFFDRSQYGLLVPPGSPSELARAIRCLLDHPEEIARVGQQARRAVLERYNNGIESKKLLSFYRAVLSS
jgi:glycosyltransferase involved in cell wall biosynthesis